MGLKTLASFANGICLSEAICGIYGINHGQQSNSQSHPILQNQTWSQKAHRLHNPIPSGWRVNRHGQDISIIKGKQCEHKKKKRRETNSYKMSHSTEIFRKNLQQCLLRWFINSNKQCRSPVNPRNKSIDLICVKKCLQCLN